MKIGKIFIAICWPLRPVIRKVFQKITEFQWCIIFKKRWGKINSDCVFSEWKLKLAGHTDNVGAERNNLILSKQRAEAVQTYLSGKGVEKERIKVEFYGETQPIASNDTPEGRQKNRRVEMEIQFE